MRPKIDADKIAKSLGAKRKGTTKPKGGYPGAAATAAEATARDIHRRLWLVCPDQDTYENGVRADLPDCASGCKHFHPLKGAAGMDWGVCMEPNSPRKGLLTFEHMGCDFWEK